MPAAMRLCPLFIRRTLRHDVHGHQSGAMTRKNRHTAHALACDSCGQMPHAAKVRLTFANVAAMLPIELVVHAAVVHAAMPYLLKVLVLTLTATVLVIWVAEPSVRVALRGWLHAPALRHRRRLHVTHADLLAAAGAGGGRGVSAWPPATPLAVADGQTKALALALRVAGDPDELQLAVAELLDAEPVANPTHPIHPTGDCIRPKDGAAAYDGTLLKIPSPWHGPLGFSRPRAPFTPPNLLVHTGWPNWPNLLNSCADALSARCRRSHSAHGPASDRMLARSRRACLPRGNSGFRTPHALRPECLILLSGVVEGDQQRDRAGDGEGSAEVVGRIPGLLVAVPRSVRLAAGLGQTVVQRHVYDHGGCPPCQVGCRPGDSDG